jgi:hypothetical protein
MTPRAITCGVPFKIGEEWYVASGRRVDDGGIVLVRVEAPRND